MYNKGLIKNGKKRTMLAALFLCWLFNTALVSELAEQHSYRITRNGKEIGKLHVLKQQKSDHFFISMHARIHSQFILPLTIVTRDEAMFKKGVLTQSTVYREVNNKVTVSRKTVVQGKNYQLQDGDKSTLLNRYPIAMNMMLLYLNEPVGVKQIYSDHYQQFVEVVKTGQHVYKVILPEGAYNSYEYKDNACYRVQVFNKLYDAVFELEK